MAITLSATLWIPAFAGMTVPKVGGERGNPEDGGTPWDARKRDKPAPPTTNH